MNASHRWAAYSIIFALTFGLLSAAVCRTKPLLSANDRSRWCTVWSLVERGTYQIDEIDAVPGWGTIDKVRHHDHFYSSKPPVLSTIVAGVYWVVRAVSGLRLNESLDRETEVTARVILFVINVVPMLAGVAVMIGVAERYAWTDFTRVFAVSAFALATFLTTFAMTLNNHTVAALSLLVSLAAGCRIVADRSIWPGHFALCGFFAAFAAVNELPAAAFAAAVCLLVAVRSARATVAWFLPAALVPIAAFFVTNYFATGEWKPFYAYYGTDKYKYVVDGIPSYWLRPAGLDANVESPFSYFLNCTFGHHGIFSLSPIFLLALAAWLKPSLSRGSALRIWVWLSAALTAIVIAFYLTRTENYNYGGNCAGLRWAFWLIPLWIVAMMPTLDAMSGRRSLRWTACVLLAATAFSSWYAIDNPWQHPWLYVLMERVGLIHPVPPPEKFNLPVASFFPLLPPDDDAQEWVEFASAEPSGEMIRLRLSDEGSVERDGHRLRKIKAVWSSVATNRRSLDMLIDPVLFEAGEPPSRFLVWDNSPADAETRRAAETFVQGLPSFQPYHRGAVRYLKTPLRHDAFECRRAAAQVETEDPDGNGQRYRTDVWLTAAVPFGVLQFEQTARDGESGELLTSRRWTAAASSRTSGPKPIPSRKTQSAVPPLNIPAD